jgi:hypothetical protein
MAGDTGQKLSELRPAVRWKSKFSVNVEYGK